MRVLFLTQYFFPETGATSNRVYSLAEYAQQQGHEVLVVAEKPNHPEGVIPQDFRGKAFIRRRWGPLNVLYCWVFTRPKKNALTRLAFYTSFMLSAVVGALRHASGFDIVVASSPPLFVGPAGWLIARLTGAKFVLDVRDLWPDVAIALGALRNPILAWLSRRLERFLYLRADGISAVTNSFCEHIRQVLPDERPVELVMNGTVPDIFSKENKRNEIRARLEIDHQFAVLFAGNLGLAQGLEHILEAASKLSTTHPDVLFLFLGSGPLKELLLAEAAQLGLHNIRFLPRTTLEDSAAHMAAADALIVSLGDHPIYQKFIPSKLFDCMAAGRPVLLSVDGEARSILEAANAGIYYPAENADGLAKAIIALKTDSAAAARMGQNGRRFAVAHCTREEQARIMIHFIQQILENQRA